MNYENECSEPLRIGILGAARIARKNIAAIQHQVSHCKVTAIASRSLEKAEALKKNHVTENDHQLVKVFAGATAYDEMLQSDLIDAVYIPLPTCLKKEWVLKAIANEKHVLVEKPVATSVEHYEEMIAAAKEVKKFIMDGTMFVHNTRTHHILDYISQEEKFGSITRINSEFTFRGDDDFFANDIRTNKKGDPYGCIGDLGWYCVRLAQLVFHKVGANKLKSAMVANWKLNEEGVPIDATCLVHFHDDNAEGRDGDRLLSFHCSFIHPLRQRAEICGTKESADISDYVIPKEGPSSFRAHSMKLTQNDTFTVHCGDLIEVPSGPVQEVMMWRNFRKLCKSVEENGWVDDNEASTLTSISSDTQLIMDALMESIRKDGLLVRLDK